MSEEKKAGIDRAGLTHPEDWSSEAAVDALLSETEAVVNMEKAHKGDRGFFAWVAYHLSSLQTTVLFLCVIAVLSVIGTVVPQGAEAARYVDAYGQLKAAIMMRLGFTDIYHTVYFNLLLGWIGLSSVWCTIERSVRTLKLQFAPRVKIRASTIERLKHSRTASAGDGKTIFEAIDAKLRKDGWKTYRIAGESETLNLYAAIGMRRMWSLVILHIGIVVVMFGALIGLFFGTNGMVRLEDGETKVLTIHPAEEDFAVSKGIDGIPTMTGMERETTGAAKTPLLRKMMKRVTPMTFTLELDKFEITYDKLIKLPPWVEDGGENFKEFESYIVRQFTSEFTVSRDGRTKSKVISVNYPLHLDKLMFYQSAFDRSVEIVATTGEGQTFTELVGMNVPFVLTPTGFRAAGMGETSGSPFFMVIEDIKAGEWYSGREPQGELTPMAQIGFFASETGEFMGSEIIKKDVPLELIPGIALSLGDRIQSASIFQYKRDPGIPLVYLGFVMILLGTLGSLFLKFKQVYICISDGKVRIGLRSTGLVDDSEKFFDSLTSAAS